MSTNLSSYPIHNGDDLVYLRIKALTWAANHGLIPEMIQPSAGKLLAEIIRQVSPEKTLVVNFYGIGAFIDDHSLDDVGEALKSTERKMVVINARQVQQQLTSYIQIEPRITLPNGTVIFNSGNEQDGYGITDKVARIEADTIRGIVRQCYEQFPEMKRLKSTPIYASGVFNARKIISNRSSFMWTCLLMSERLTQIMDGNESKASRLLAVSLRASPFAGALGILGSLDIEIVDHMGPDLKILEEYTLGINQEYVNYIYIGDWIIGGTELKIAETYAVARNCVVDHALVIGSLFAPKDYEGRHASPSKVPRVHSLVRLKEAQPDSKYEIEKKNA